MTFSQNEQKYPVKFFLIFVIGIFFGAFLVFLLFKTEFLTKENAGESEKTATGTSFSQNVNNVKNLVFSSSKVQEVYDILDASFYGFDKKTTKELEDGMITAMLQSLGDKHSEYFDSEETEEFQSGLQGEFEGIGAVVGESEFGAIIERILPGSPAEKSGLKNLDIITAADGVSIKGMTTSEAVKLIRGEKGTTVNISYLRDNIPATVDVVRDAVNIPSVDGEMIENTNIGYIQINTFGEKTPGEFEDKVRELKEKGAAGLILDFRYNGGGYLTSAQSILGEFLPRNSKIVTTKENNSANNITLTTSLRSPSDEKIPLIVLVNEYSASASEIVAGAMQDYGRALVIGNKTYGKGSVQEMFPLGDGSMIKITVAHWYTPKDKNIDAEGITPDITALLTVDDYKNSFDRQKKFAEKVMKELIEGKNSTEIVDYYKSHSDEITALQ